MEFRNQLVEAISAINNEKLLCELGYSHPAEKQISRLENVISSPVLGLDESYFDFHYSNSDYIKKLTEIAGLAPKLAEDYIRETQDDLTAKRQAFKPFIFIDTGFKRASQPIFALAALEHIRYLILPDDFNEKSPEDQLDVVHKAIDKNLEDTKGSIGIWGNVISYFYVFDKGYALEISPNGKVLGVHRNYTPGSRATLYLS